MEAGTGLPEEHKVEQRVFFWYEGNEWELSPDFFKHVLQTGQNILSLMLTDRENLSVGSQVPTSKSLTVQSYRLKVSFTFLRRIFKLYIQHLMYKRMKTN